MFTATSPNLATSAKSTGNSVTKWPTPKRPARSKSLKRRSDYLCTLTYAPSWQQRFGRKTMRFRTAARQEDVKTTHAANRFARKRGFEPAYHPWKVFLVLGFLHQSTLRGRIISPERWR